MHASQITLDKFAGTIEPMTDIQTQIAGSQIVYSGDHPEHGNIIMMQVGANDKAILIQL